MSDIPIYRPADLLEASAKLCDAAAAEYTRRMAEPGGLTDWAKMNAQRDVARELAADIRSLAGHTPTATIDRRDAEVRKVTLLEVLNLPQITEWTSDGVTEKTSEVMVSRAAILALLDKAPAHEPR